MKKMQKTAGGINFSPSTLIRVKPSESDISYAVQQDEAHEENIDVKGEGEEEIFEEEEGEEEENWEHILYNV